MPKKSRPSPPHPDLPPLHPGELLREDVLPELNMEVPEVARALGIPTRTMRDILDEKKPVTPEIAVRLGAAFNPSAEMWLRLQGSFDLWHARRETDTTGIRHFKAPGEKRASALP